MMKSLYPGMYKFAGCVGKDAQAESLVDILQKEGVISLMCNNGDYPTGSCASIVIEKERSLVANIGAALHFP
jgi:adenosine kinase